MKKIFEKVDAKMVLGIVSTLVTVASVIVGNKQKDFERQETAEQAAKIVMDKMSNQK